MTLVQMRHSLGTEFGRKLAYLPETLSTIEELNTILEMHRDCVEARNIASNAENVLLRFEASHLFCDFIRYISGYLYTQKTKLEDKLRLEGRLCVEDSKLIQRLDEFFGE